MLGQPWDGLDGDCRVEERSTGEILSMRAKVLHDVQDHTAARPKRQRHPVIKECVEAPEQALHLGIQSNEPPSAISTRAADAQMQRHLL